ncbi:hypothetical protein NL676_016111 [Syzygium grande]|nr:hypothetical protein NL676_016111 [Syzygium grande]
MRPLKLFLLVTFVLVALKPTQAARDIICEVLDNTSETVEPRFGDEIGFGYALEALSDASDFVFETFNQSNGGGRGYPTVLMIIESFLTNGYSPTITTNNGSQFRVNADYLQAYVGDVKAEFTGIVYHESARVWQWTGNDTAPIGLITGIADYIRLRARWPPKYWPLRGSGCRWDDGYAVKRRGFVSDLNAMMENSYSDSFFAILLVVPARSPLAMIPIEASSHTTWEPQPIDAVRQLQNAVRSLPFATAAAADLIFKEILGGVLFCRGCSTFAAGLRWGPTAAVSRRRRKSGGGRNRWPTAGVSSTFFHDSLTSFLEMFINVGTIFGYILNYGFFKLPLNINWCVMLTWEQSPWHRSPSGVLDMPEYPVAHHARTTGDAKRVLTKTYGSNKEARLQLADIKEAIKLSEVLQNYFNIRGL